MTHFTLLQKRDPNFWPFPVRTWSRQKSTRMCWSPLYTFNMVQPSWTFPIDINVTKPSLEEQNSLVPSCKMIISVHYCYWIQGTWPRRRQQASGSELNRISSSIGPDPSLSQYDPESVSKWPSNGSTCHRIQALNFALEGDTVTFLWWGGTSVK